ncbi:hypothetical protein RM863_14780 [Streptomyces sp. DSM 41014]|uniref:Lipoprotein n=1 Tax=Streptomyces hintoniae TaxID=3075521 RepID=A0ABU2UJF6_9ACTN|nr:hypothetical protein [Streptomyces sp. DSM 41014]MDT0473391.1 hypothetical protein [Streptomyces sp. DSM 41014]
MADARRQLRSGTVVLGGMGLLAAALTACSSDPDKRCVDRGSYNLGKGYRVVSDKNCKSGSGTGTWYYGGKKKGTWVESGSFSKPRKGSGSGGGGVDRGGFGGGKGAKGG